MWVWSRSTIENLNRNEFWTAGTKQNLIIENWDWKLKIETCSRLATATWSRICSAVSVAADWDCFRGNPDPDPDPGNSWPEISKDWVGGVGCDPPSRLQLPFLKTFGPKLRLVTLSVKKNNVKVRFVIEQNTEMFQRFIIWHHLSWSNIFSKDYRWTSTESNIISKILSLYFIQDNYQLDKIQYYF